MYTKRIIPCLDVKEGKVVNPVFKKGDLRPNRFLRMLKTHLKHYKYFDTYYK